MSSLISLIGPKEKNVTYNNLPNFLPTTVHSNNCSVYLMTMKWFLIFKNKKFTWGLSIMQWISMLVPCKNVFFIFTLRKLIYVTIFSVLLPPSNILFVVTCLWLRLHVFKILQYYEEVCYWYIYSHIVSFEFSYIYK